MLFHHSLWLSQWLFFVEIEVTPLTLPPLDLRMALMSWIFVKAEHSGKQSQRAQRQSHKARRPEKVKLEGGNLKRQELEDGSLKRQEIWIDCNVELKKLWSLAAVLKIEVQALLETQGLDKSNSSIQELQKWLEFLNRKFSSKVK